MAEQERVEPLLHPLAVIEQVAAGADQVPDRLLRRGRTRTGVSIPARSARVRRTASRRSVLTRSEAPFGTSDGVITSHATPIEVMSRCSS